MRRRFPWRTFALFVCVIAVVGIVVSAQAPSTNKRPLTYDVVDYWKSIPSSKLSNDGKWLAYSVTSQAEDGELVVRNLATGQEFRHPRGTGPTFTEDGRFLIQHRADEGRRREGAGRDRGRWGDWHGRRTDGRCWPRDGGPTGRRRPSGGSSNGCADDGWQSDSCGGPDDRSRWKERPGRGRRRPDRTQ